MSAAGNEDYRTVLVLMKGTDADATLDALEGSGQNINVSDEGPFWKLRSTGDIYVDMAAVEEELGGPITMGKWLGTMTSFVGFAEKSDSHFAVRAERGVAVEQSGG
ncbi:MAG TPA: MmoB/DmpM family protein [Sporichthyaceae bacterium]|nr:MmoB/DmpM family protein [Sporichthyaceae bacterium]